jgi:hypothetical protein
MLTGNIRLLPDSFCLTCQENPFPGLINAECFPFFIDVGDHHLRHFVGICRKAPLSEALFFQSVKEEIMKFRPLDNRKSHSEYRKHPGRNKILTYGYGLFTHPLGRGAR